ncbi:hypothetical protein SOPEG_0024 [Candidatus Sodalis pierantonius str. SOPE]|uniref:Uncharacterized protein n=1 Tax=Candidatus Sodalis pierantonii str. SOPE TaxID=2342 RepID=W0HGI1_9GAMM|nr:DUF1640 domain-containing protein [Candidatus Sodalis pierantonius]AHF72826.1 hypothetical protein SOPEG_0024 [Candidatus Sodalis pierantonius str. SOPE]
MGQVAFDTQEFVETLESAGLPKDQAKAISLVVRKSHEVADLATKADIADVKRDFADLRKDFSSEITTIKRDIDDVRKDLSAEIANVRKDLSIEITTVRKDLSAEIKLRFDKADTQIALLRKDVESIATGLLLKLGGVIVLTISASTAIMKFM